MSLSMKIRTISGRKAITVMIAPSWFWKKNRARSDSRAGSCLLAAFHIRLPAIAKTAITDQEADQQRQVAMVELVLAEHDDPGDFGADGDDPRDRRENAKARGGGLLAVRRTPFLGDVDLFGRLVVGHVRSPVAIVGSIAAICVHRRTNNCHSTAVSRQAISTLYRASRDSLYPRSALKKRGRGDRVADNCEVIEALEREWRDALCSKDMERLRAWFTPISC